MAKNKMTKKEIIMEILSMNGVCGLPELPEDSAQEVYEEMYRRISKSGADLNKGSTKSAILGVLKRRLWRDGTKGGLSRLVQWASSDIDAVRLGKAPPILKAERGKDWNVKKEVAVCGEGS